MVILLFALCASVAGAESQRYSVDDIKEKLVILHDKQGHFIAVHLKRAEKLKLVFYGNKKALYMTPLVGYFSDSKSFSATIRDRRVRRSNLEIKGGQHHITCDSRKTNLFPLDSKAAAQFIKSAKFYGPLVQRAPHFLARNDFGVYFFVNQMEQWDVVRKSPSVKLERRMLNDFQLFRGTPGQMKELKMKNVVSDSEGKIFASKSGVLRLILRSENGVPAKTAEWIKGKKRTLLTVVPIRNNRQLIYKDLGVYEGKRSGLPCDDL